MPMRSSARSPTRRGAWSARSSRAGAPRPTRGRSGPPSPPIGYDSPMALFDTHAHLHFPDFADDLDAVLARARDAGVRGIVTIGTDRESNRATVAMAERHPDVWASVGIHPHDAAEATEDDFAELERLARSPRVVGIGEMGLD